MTRTTQTKTHTRRSRNAAADINRRLALIELMYNTEVKGNPFVISFDDLSKLVVTGVWNKEQRRLEF